ncbi:hypothetical protein [Ruminococcus sp.]|uniref:hypothetical protein n=1 Tax=Ruminococcus sp. TaxID=41978 RepID=UPI002E80772C|nr:hypothetical protein [Ruminococcus sp.]MEE3440267.1 hypothetical protein [Ruminococcus sp.]
MNTKEIEVEARLSKNINIAATLPVVQVNRGGGMVNDVLVNEESVVVDRIAHITLPENLDERLQNLENKYVAEIIAKINGSVKLSLSTIYAGYPKSITATANISLPSEVNANYVELIEIEGNGQSASGSGQTSISVTSTVSGNTTFEMTGKTLSPYTKTVTKPASVSKVCPIYIGIVDNNVDTASEAIEAIKKDANLYSPNSPVSNIKTITNMQFTYAANQRLAFICGQSNVGVKEVGALANDTFIVKESATINGVGGYVYITSPQQAGTRNITFNA